VLDDLWDKEHVSHFALIDETTQSRVLISSRVRGTLASCGCEVTTLSLPTDDDAIQMVMAAAGMAHGPGRSVPSEAAEVIRLCRRLPLTLGIAGRLVRDLELQHDWFQVAQLMKEELSGEGEARSAEDGIISTSLRTLKGPHAEHARALLRAFRLVPEDVKVPLEALALIYRASSEAEAGAGAAGGGTSPPSLLQLRRWTQMLIERCLVLPPIDTPSVHDMVLDYADAQTTQGVTKKAHRRLIDLFRQGRPGPSGWDAEVTEGRLSGYILRHSVHHVEHSWRTDWESDEDALTWLDDYDGVSQDAIPLASAAFLGTERVSQLARQAESEGEWWSAALRWSATATVNRGTDGVAAAQPLLKLCAAALERVQPATAIEVDAKASLELSVLVAILLAWNPPDVPLYMSRLTPLMDTKAAKAAAEMRSCVFLMRELYPNVFSVVRKGLRNAEEMLFGQLSNQFLSILLEGVRSAEPGSRRHKKLLALCFSFNISIAFLDMMTEHAEFDWEHSFGTRGQLLNDASRAYDFDKHHKQCLKLFSFDGNLHPSHVLPLFVHWGDLENANSNADRHLSSMTRFLTQPQADSWTLAKGILEWPQMLYLLNRNADAMRFMREAGADWHAIIPTMADIVERTPLINEGNRVTLPAMMSGEDLIWNIRMLWLLVSDDAEISVEQVLSELPAAEELAHFGVNYDGSKKTMHLSHMSCWTSLAWPALALEKLGQFDAALAYATKELETDQTSGGSNSARMHSLAQRCRGRLLASSGRMDEAHAAFDAAGDEAARNQYWMLAALAARDLAKHVLEPSGQLGASGRRLHMSAYVEKLTGSRESLSALLGAEYV
jgi:hypothetical protein